MDKTYHKEIIDNLRLNDLPDEYWKTPGEIITDVDYLSEPTTPVDSLELGEKIAAKLLYTLKKSKTGIALTANQIGISKSVFVVNVINPMIFINPEITGMSSDTLIYNEYCLSIPKKRCKVKRHFNINIKALNIPDGMTVGVTEQDYKLNDPLSRKIANRKLLECIAIQHEFDHTQGILMTDNDLTLKPIVNTNKFGRNDKITIERGIETMEIKFKHLDGWKKQGWTIVETPGELVDA